VYVTTSKNGTTNDVASVNVQNSGDMNSNVDTITFNHSTGKVTSTFTNVDGSPFILDGMGFVLSPGSESQTVAYANDATSFTFDVAGPNQTKYNAYYANINSSTKTPQFMVFGGIEQHKSNPAPCSTSGIAIHQ
jgi:hypothetical protein